MAAAVVAALPLALAVPAAAEVTTPALVAVIEGRGVAVLDGDSLLVDGVEWRLIGYDAPEIERATCEGERRTGILARLGPLNPRPVRRGRSTVLFQTVGGVSPYGKTTVSVLKRPRRYS